MLSLAQNVDQLCLISYNELYTLFTNKTRWFLYFVFGVTNHMLDLQELSEEELAQYTDSMSDIEHDAPRENIAYLFKEIENGLADCNKLVGDARKDEENLSYNKLVSHAEKLAVKLGKMSKTARLIPVAVGAVKEESRIRYDMVKPVDVRFFKEDGYLRIRLPELLPHRPHFDVVSYYVQLSYDVDSWRASYMDAFGKAFATGKYVMFSEKISLCYILHIYSGISKSRIPDCDNYDTKVITDIIASYILTDDSFLCCNQFVDAVIDDKLKSVEECYTDIIACPTDRREEILKSCGY